jgi:hypothetical protein
MQVYLISLIVLLFLFLFFLIFQRKEKWEFLTHSTPILNKKNFEKLVYSDQALLPNKRNKEEWINLIKNSVAQGNFPQEIKDFVATFNNETPLVEIFVKYPSLKIIFTKELKQEIYKQGLMFPGVYTQYIFKDLYFQGREWYYTDNIIFIFNRDALKDLPYIVCNSVNYGQCAYDDLKDGFYGVGNLKILPSQDKVQNMINQKILKNKEYNNQKVEKLKKELEELKATENPNPIWIEEVEQEILGYQSDSNLFKYSNEILFDELPFSYVDAIITTDEDNLEWIKNIVDPLGTPVYYIPEEEIEFSKLK